MSAAPPGSVLEEAEHPRRVFLAQVIAACVTFASAVIGIPAIGALIGPALRREEANWLPLGDPASFRVGVPTAVNLSITSQDGWIKTTQVKTVWVVAQPGGDIRVFNGRCTHLGCAYSWQAAGSEFVCPCHGGMFALDGSVQAGPPPRPLDTLPTRVENGALQVQYQDFRLGVPTKIGG